MTDPGRASAEPLDPTPKGHHPVRPALLARHLASAAALLALGFVLAACASGQATAGWTFGPLLSPSTSPGASAGPSGAAPSASAAPSAVPGGGSGGGTATVVKLAALGIKFDQASIDAPGGQVFQIAFDNHDTGIPHNVYITDAGGKTVFDGGTPITGPAQKTYDVPALQAGTYMFHCVVHPTMVGTLNVK